MTHMFETETAVAIGLEPTLVLNVIKTNLNPDSTYHDISEHWKIFTLDDWNKYLGFLSGGTFTASLSWLKRKGLIEIEQPQKKYQLTDMRQDY